ncbi:MAG: hypothetical protein DRQ89_14355 [Epsilonproteobacteria bacterium]|nr:MAG: hypothetical protein DRQ89_14355 [Campylobacterota bacterium]
MCPYSRTTGEPYGILKVIGGGSLSLSAEFEDLFGGSNKYAWASEAKTIASEFTSSVKSMPDFLFEVYLGASVATTAASALGSILDALANVNGTSAFDATTGVATVTVKSGSEADLKDAKYLVKAVSATTVDVFMYTDVAADKGTDITYEDDLLKITATALTIVAATAVEIPNTGLELTGGSGVIALVTGDTADCRVAAAHGGVSEITIGESTSSFPEHGIVALGAKRADGSLFEIDIFKAVGGGFPISLEETVFSIPELTIKLLYDSAKNAVAKITATAGQ